MITTKKSEIASEMKRYKFPPGKQILGYSIAIVYLWFGALKFVPGLSPAEGLASETIGLLTFDLLPESYALTLLAIWECTIGILLLTGFLRKTAISLAMVHILLTFTPMLLLPETVFSGNPLFLTLTGQYIGKNIIIVSALLYLRQDMKQADFPAMPQPAFPMLKYWKVVAFNGKSVLGRWLNPGS